MTDGFKVRVEIASGIGSEYLDLCRGIQSQAGGLRGCSERGNAGELSDNGEC